MNYRLLAFGIGALIGSAVMLGELLPQGEVYVAQIPYCESRGTEPNILARAGYAYDGATGALLYDKSADAQLPLASLTKVMTVVTALDTLGATSVTITRDSLTPDGEYGLRVGEVWEAQDLADFTLVGSVNDGARALMLAATQVLGGEPRLFYDAMNRRARAEGLLSTYFVNETGLDETAVTAGAYGSAHDVAHLFMQTAERYPSLVEKSVQPSGTFTSLTGIRHTIDNTSLVASTFASPILSKTGYTDLAGGNLAVVFEPFPGHPISVAILGSSKEGRDQDMRVVAQYATKELKRILECESLR
ncbi:MAG: hypothetical protein AAB955_01920, partial [Patescibacteria group bacterium]